MRIAIMQPYFMPYLGYWQLIHAVDAFVVYDDVNYIKGGWINRNYILGHGSRQLFSINLEGASPNRKIRDLRLFRVQHKLNRTLQQNYRKAPYFGEVYPVLEAVLNFDETNLTNYLVKGLKKLSFKLGMTPNWLLSSNLSIGESSRGQVRVLEICKKWGGTTYVNLPGGIGLYDAEEFHGEGLNLLFLYPEPPSYEQFGAVFQPNLSIIDVLMFNGWEGTRELLACYRLEGKEYLQNL